MANMDDASPERWHETVQTFETTGFRNESNGQPLVYGYVRSAVRRPNSLAVCRRALERYCQRERLWLCTVFADYGVDDEELIRPGLAGLCDVLCLPDSFSAVLASVNQLSRDNRVAEQLIQQIRGTGARLLFVRQGADGAAANMASGSSSLLPEWWQ